MRLGASLISLSQLFVVIQPVRHARARHQLPAKVATNTLHYLLITHARVTLTTMQIPRTPAPRAFVLCAGLAISISAKNVVAEEFTIVIAA